MLSLQTRKEKKSFIYTFGIGYHANEFNYALVIFKTSYRQLLNAIGTSITVSLAGYVFAGKIADIELSAHSLFDV